MVWKSNRTRIANVIERLQIRKGDLQIFLRACFRIAYTFLFLYGIYSTILVVTDISFLSCHFYRWHLSDLRGSLSSICEQQIAEGLAIWQLPVLIEALKEEYSYIHSYSIVSRGDSGHSLFLWGYPLICKINNDSIFASNGKMYSIERVDDDCSAVLDQVYINKEVLEASDLKKFVKPLSHLVNKGWHISIATPNDIQLFDDAYKKYVVTCDADSYDMCEKHRTSFCKMETKSRLHVKKNQQLLFDMRFQGQIVVKIIKKREILL
ncbi:hypothetical protein JKY79_02060 [Candidatus Babeliales bacterium]|nr:hypothetical protein [Candidatus Babeliales bacterium]